MRGTNGLLLVMGDTKKIKTIRYDMDKYSVYRFPGPAGLPILVVETSLFFGNLDFIHFSLQSSIAKELHVVQSSNLAADLHGGCG